MADSSVKVLNELIEVVVQSIPKERDAHNLYMSAATKADSDMTRLLFESLARQELEHEAKLKAVLKLLQNEKQRISKG